MSLTFFMFLPLVLTTEKPTLQERIVRIFATEM